MRPHVLAFDNLTECSLSEDIENEISACNPSDDLSPSFSLSDLLVTSAIVGREDVVHVKDIVIVLVV